MRNKLERPSFILILIVISLFFLYLMIPFTGPLLWSCIVAFLFQPLHSFFLQRFNHKKNTAALVTIVLVILIVVLPSLFIMTILISQGVDFFERLESREIDPRLLVDKFVNLLPYTERFLAMLNMDISDVKDGVANSSTELAKFATKNVLSLGQDTMQFFVNLGLFCYVGFFFIRDGRSISQTILNSFPLSPERNKLLFTKFREVTRATVKGNLVIAVIQGVLGGLIFSILGLPAALLWGVLMIFLSLIPVVGAFVIWLPVALFFIATGEHTKGIVLIIFGAVVIGLVDNFLRPILIGKETKLPDYLVLLSTLGGLTLFGINGFILGPLIAAFFITVWNLFEQDANEDPEYLCPNVHKE